MDILKSTPITRTLLRHVSIIHILILVWIYYVYWGERLVFYSSIRKCNWENWEKWSPSANPYHVIFVADPQLVDPHTYPGRPWPLDSLTVAYTDIYLRRVYTLLQQNLYPDSTIFLGDLFDGGREWSTDKSQSPEERWHRYGESFWLREYERFAGIFFDPWIHAGIWSQVDQKKRRQILSNLPGNHDLGFASGIQKPVRNRFNAYFGEGNRIDILGNHTFISLDTVSLSAKQDQNNDAALWLPPQEFLDRYPTALSQEVSNYIGNKPKMSHKVYEGGDLVKRGLPVSSSDYVEQFPSVLLTHVPLYRDPGTPCGKNREHWPPTMDGKGNPLEIDERNAITVAAGYQYQNVLSLETSKEITKKLGNLSYAFSGDDHDYCDTTHRQYPSGGDGIREITVKSLSWAMGVRRPGFQLLSLWNPLDLESKNFKSRKPPGSTLQTHLCLLPDQLGIFISYGKLLVITILLIFARSTYVTRTGSHKSDTNYQPILPISVTSHEDARGESSSSDENSAFVPTARPRTSTKSAIDGSQSNYLKAPTGYGLPAPKSSMFANSRHSRKKISKGQQWLWESSRSMFIVVMIVLPFYIWLLRNG